MRSIVLTSIIAALVVSCGVLSRQNVSRAGTDAYLRSVARLSDEVVIRRTDYGVPHIYADNMKAAGFALGWVQAEDYGRSMPEQLIRARGEWALYNEIPGDRLEAAINSDASNRMTYMKAVRTWLLLDQDARDFLDGFAAGINIYIHQNGDEFEEWMKPFFTGIDVHARSIVTYDNAAVRRFIESHSRQKSIADGASNDSPAADDGTVDGTVSNTVNTTANTTVNTTVNGPVNITVSDPVNGPVNDHPGLASQTGKWWSVPLDEYNEYEISPDDGSNVWAFSPERTKSGRAILMRNPHLSWTAGYYEAHIIVPGKLNFYGDFRAGYGLGIIGGFNARLGFATTNNDPDLDDIYSFDLDGSDSLAVIVDGRKVPIKRESLMVYYKTDRGIESKVREFLSLPWGPVILRDDKKAYIIKSAGDGEHRSGEQFMKMMMAQNFDEWEAAMKMRAKVNSNLTYADADGNIFYVWNATMPDRPHDALPDTVAVHVERSDQMWHNILPWERLPMLKNPAGGYVRNENDPFHQTNLYEPLPPERFPAYFGEPRLRLRSQHSLELIHNDLRFSLEEVADLKHSMRMILADRVKDDLIAAVEESLLVGKAAGATGSMVAASGVSGAVGATGSVVAASGVSGTVGATGSVVAASGATVEADEVAEALQMLREWDNTVAASSRGGLLFETWWDRYVVTADSVRVPGSPASVGYAATPEKLFTRPWSYDDPMATPSGLADPVRAVAAFHWALAETRRLYGHWNLAWGDVHRAVRGDVDVPVGGGGGLPGCFRVLNFIRHRNDPMKREVNGGDGWVIAVEFTDIPKAFSVLAYGQSTRDDSPFHSDQIRNFAENRLTPVAFTTEDVMKQLIREYRPGKK